MFIFFFSWRRTDFVVLTRKNTVAILQSDIRRHTGTFRRKLQTAFTAFLLPVLFFSFTRTSCGLNIVGNAPFTTFFILHKVFTMSLIWCRNAVNICAGRGRLKLLVSSPAKGAPFLSKLFLTRKLEKVEVWSRFGIVFLHENGTIPQIYLFCFQNKRLCCVFIPLSLVLML